MLQPTRSSKAQKAGFEELNCGFWLALCTYHSLFPLGIIALSEQSHWPHPSGSERDRVWGMPVWKLRGPTVSHLYNRDTVSSLPASLLPPHSEAVSFFLKTDRAKKPWL